MIFLDTSFLVAYKIENDVHHEKALGIMKEIISGNYGDPIISDYIFGEVVTVILVKSKRIALAVQAGSELKDALDAINVDNDIFDEGWRLFSSQKNTFFSFIDCATLSFMKRKKIYTIATFDKEFLRIKGIKIIDGT